MKYKIEHNVPMPNRRNTGLAEAIKALKVGDSFLIPVNRRATAHGIARYNGYRVSVRKDTDGNMRIWRIE